MQPFFTLILPCYKVAAYVERCVQSILTQDFSDYEILLVDDGSPDETPAICDRLAAEHPCIRVVHKENGGLSSARNAGMEAAQGRYIWFVDSDDWIEPGALMLLHQACMNGASEIVKFSHYRVTETSVAVPHNVEPGLYEGKDRCDVLCQKAFCEAGKYSLSAWSHVYRRSFLERSGVHFVSERTIGSEDYLFNLQLLLGSVCIRVLADPLYSYVLRQGSLTQTYKPDLGTRYTELYRLLTAVVQEKYSDQEQRWVDRLYACHLMAGTCFSHEYFTITDLHPMQLAREKVRELLGSPELRIAAKRCDKSGLRWQKRIQLLAMRCGLEGLFYWIYTNKLS